MKLLFKLSTCILLLCSTPIFSQNTTNWFSPGSKWIYSYEGMSGYGEEYLDLVGQEMVGGELCAKMHYHGFHNGWVSSPVDMGFRYFFARNDSVFLWENNAFKLLYDFNRMQGDTFSVSSGFYDHGFVEQTGDTLWNGIPLRYQDLKLIGTPFSPGGDTLFLNTRVYERLGGTHLIYWNIESPLTEIQYYLDCYRDDEYPQQDCPLGYDPTYTSFPQYGKSFWSEKDGSWCDFRGYQYMAEHDTVIWGVGQGKKISVRNTYRGNDPCPIGSTEILHESFRLAGLLDQSIQYKKVYFTRLSSDPSIFPICVSPDSLPLNQYKLLYDFDLSIGDTLHWKPQPNVVLAIDSIQLDNSTWRRTFVFDTLAPHFWIEGIGSNFGLLGAYANTQVTDQFCGLQCFRFNQTMLYSIVDAFLCDSLISDAHEPKGFDHAVRLFPNPNSGVFNLEIPSAEYPALLRIFDALGRELGQLTLEEGKPQIDLRPWQVRGMLMLQIQGAGGQTAARIVRLE